MDEKPTSNKKEPKDMEKQWNDVQAALHVLDLRLKYLQSHGFLEEPQVPLPPTTKPMLHWAAPEALERYSPDGDDLIFSDEHPKSMEDSTIELKKRWMHYLKIGGLLFIWGIFTYILIVKSEHGANTIHQISVSREKGHSFWIIEMPEMRRVSVEIGGSLLPPIYGNLSKHWASIWVEMVQTNSTLVSDKYVTRSENISEIWTVPIVSENLIDFVPEVKRTHVFSLRDVEESLVQGSVIRLQVRTNLNIAFPVSLSYDLSPIDPKDGILYAAAILFGLYGLVIFEVVHRTLAAVMASTMSIAALAAFDERPSKSELVTWIDIETLLLLFSMMTLVGMLSETGIFDYLAVYAYKLTRGRVRPLIMTLCCFTAFISSCLDNVTTVLLMTPVTIRLCEVMGLDPVNVLMAMVIYSNIGGAITPVGDPPNVIIANNKDVIEAGVTFGTFTLHMGIGLLLVLIAVSIQMNFMYKNIEVLRKHERKERESQHEIGVLKRVASSIATYSIDESNVRNSLEQQAVYKKRKLVASREEIHDIDELEETNEKRELIDDYEETLKKLQKKYPIKNKVLLKKCVVTFIFLAFLFSFHSTPWINLSLGWAALLAVILLFILSNPNDVEGVLARVEWTTLIFFTALFILMEALARLGLIEWIGKKTEAVILSVEKPWQLTVAILLVLWVSAFASSFVDNIPLTTMMIKVITSLSQNEQLELPLTPLVWSLALGACLGGNGTLIGSSSNVVCAGVAEQHGFRFSFMQFVRIGFPVLINSVLVTSAYLLISHVALTWH